MKRTETILLIIGALAVVVAVEMMGSAQDDTLSADLLEVPGEDVLLPKNFVVYKPLIDKYLVSYSIPSQYWRYVYALINQESGYDTNSFRAEPYASFWGGAPTNSNRHRSNTYQRIRGIPHSYADPNRVL